MFDMIQSNLTKLMAERGYSIRMLASCANLSVQTIQRARCKQIAECKLSTLNAIAAVLNLPICSLFEEDEEADVYSLPDTFI